jgi:hypothetical protein
MNLLPHCGTKLMPFNTTEVAISYPVVRSSMYTTTQIHHGFVTQEQDKRMNDQGEQAHTGAVI